MSDPCVEMTKLYATSMLFIHMQCHAYMYVSIVDMRDLKPERSFYWNFCISFSSYVFREILTVNMCHSIRMSRHQYVVFKDNTVRIREGVLNM